MNNSIVIELVNGKITGIYSDTPDINVIIHDDFKVLTDEQEDAIELEVAQHPFILYGSENM